MRKKMIESKVVKVGCEEMLQCIETWVRGGKGQKVTKPKITYEWKTFLGMVWSNPMA